MQKTKFNMSEMIRIRDERVKGLGDSNYYYFNYVKDCGVLVEYRDFSDETSEIPLSELFSSFKDVQTCKVGISDKIVYCKNRIEIGDYKIYDKFNIEFKLKKLEESIEFFNTPTYDGFTRKMKIKSILKNE